MHWKWEKSLDFAVNSNTQETCKKEKKWFHEMKESRCQSRGSDVKLTFLSLFAWNETSKTRKEENKTKNDIKKKNTIQSKLFDVAYSIHMQDMTNSIQNGCLHGAELM